MYESFIRGEEEEVEEEVEEDEDEDELRATVLEEAWAAARPSRNKELQVTIMAAIIITMVIILAHLEDTPFKVQICLRSEFAVVFRQITVNF